MQVGPYKGAPLGKRIFIVSVGQGVRLYKFLAYAFASSQPVSERLYNRWVRLLRSLPEAGRVPHALPRK